jgi:dipeptidase E
MAQRLHAAGVMEDLRRAVGGGLPYIGVSAGAVLCGPDILTTNDINACGCTTFSGLGLIPFSLNVHFPAGEESALEREDRLREYLRFHDRLILALCEDACVRVTDGAVEAVRGTVWKLERGVERVCLPGGALCPKIP